MRKVQNRVRKKNSRKAARSQICENLESKKLSKILWKKLNRQSMKGRKNEWERVTAEQNSEGLKKEQSHGKAFEFKVLNVR